MEKILHKEIIAQRCRADKDRKIVILNYDDYDAIMTRELQQFEKLDVSVGESDTYLEKVRKDCS